MANHAGVYDAIYYPLVKALLARRGEEQGIRGDWRYINMFFPLLVTNGPLYTIDPSTMPYAAVRADYVSFTRQIKGKNINGRFSVDFVSLGALEGYWLRAVLPFIEHVVELIKAKPKLFG